MKKIRVLIADDERAARQELKRLLQPYPDFEVVAEAGNTDDAAMQIAALHPDLLFLDIQMPEGSGFDLLQSLEEVPEVIFVTAFDQYAVQAFETNALDYLLKPIRDERFAKTIEKFRKQFAAKSINTSLQKPQQVFIKDGQHYYFVPWNDVYLIESLDNYARLHFHNKKALIKSSLNQLEQKLSEHDFFRVNRAQLINTRFIQHIHAMTDGKIEVTLQNGERVKLSERQSARFRSQRS